MSNMNFNEVAQAGFEVFDYARCQRPDGSYYGTSGQCRKGALVDDKEKAAKKEKKSKSFGELRDALVKAQFNYDEALDNGTEDEFSKASDKKSAIEEKVRAKAESIDPSISELTEKIGELGMKRAFLELDGKEVPEALNDKVDKLFERRDKKVEVAMKRGQRLEEKAAKEKLVAEAQAPKEKIKAGLKGKESLESQEKRAAGEPPEYNPKIFNGENAEKAIHSYTKGYTAKSMNDCSRKNNCSERMQNKMAKLDKVIAELPANTSGGSHFRGMVVDKAVREQFLKLKPGQQLRDNGYASFSRDPGIANRFASNGGKGIGIDNSTKFPVIIESRSKKLRNIERMSDYQNEREAVLPRGTRQKITEVKETDGVVYIYTE